MQIGKMAYIALSELPYKIILSDLGNCYRNGTIVILHFFGGVAIVSGADHIARKLFNSEDPHMSNLTSIIAFTSATAASYYLAPHSLLVKFQALKLTQIILLIITSLGLTKDNTLTPRVIASWVGCVGITGVLSGSIGHRSLIAAGFFGAGLKILSLKI